MNILVMDVGGTAVKHGIVSDAAIISGYGVTPSKTSDASANLYNLLNIARSYSGYDRVSICTAGIVDSVNGVIIQESGCLPYGNGLKIREYFADKLGKPVYIENDVNCAALGEAWAGAGMGCENFVMLAYGTSIGGAIVINGGLYRGARFGGGELGHTVTHAFGEKCDCGLNGCYARYASASALIRAARAYDASIASGEEIAARMELEPGLYGAVSAWADEACVGIANAVHFLDPELVILGGGIMESERIYHTVVTRVKAFLIESYRGVKIARAEAFNRAGMLGAAYFALERVNDGTDR